MSELENLPADIRDLIRGEPGRKLLQQPTFNESIIASIMDQHRELDYSQAAAVFRILTRRLTTIEGPPGTGKTHVIEVAVRQFDITYMSTGTALPSLGSQSQSRVVGVPDDNEQPIRKAPRTQVLVISPTNASASYMLRLLKARRMVNQASHSFLNDDLLRIGRPDKVPKELHAFMPNNTSNDISDRHLKDYERLQKELDTANKAFAASKTALDQAIGAQTDTESKHDAELAGLKRAQDAAERAVRRAEAALVKPRTLLERISNLLQSAKVIFATPCAADSDILRSALNVGLVIIDGANMVPLPALSLPFVHVHQDTRIAIVGDRSKLPPVIQLKNASSYNFGSSILEHLEKVGCPFHRLNIQHRYNLAIADFVNKPTSVVPLETSPKNAHIALKFTDMDKIPPSHPLRHTCALIETTDGYEDREGTSYIHKDEAELAISLAEDVFRFAPCEWPLPLSGLC